MAGLSNWSWWAETRGLRFEAWRNLKFLKEKEMSRDYETMKIDRVAIELEARRLRAEAIASGVRSIRNWTMSAFHRRGASRTA
jgi:hypothetical protein